MTTADLSGMVLGIFGPTASGKTAVAEAIADAVPSQIVSADSMQVYQGLPIVTNPVGVHPQIIAPGASGYPPKSEDEWVGAIRVLVADPDTRRAMGRAARARVEADYSVAAWSGGFVAAMAGAGTIAGPKNPITGKAVPR